MEMKDSIDAVVVATADHSHALVAAKRDGAGKTCLLSKTIDSFPFTNHAF